ncbi:NAD(P)H-dependent glycerol-3-phosphate dehydrogenase [Dongia rigui]|uniref:Glycerol-3-phosphate dehydrogenase [NAD(P)+] n=1 Tax=Dongia rigui TaxID=940149 RepID=A0ABU5DXB0_9PROT|nr:NAD(P)H-dependent glycerol-3-phosphate dehydrogenase [Dongia rigui]MDY0871946.1 NAD(P)H-dependent glycerol-3-phosphate dehydrogenase [Dongia rigui]
MSIERVSIIGAGAWGTALALIAARAGRQTTLFVRRAELATDISAQRQNADYLPGIALPEAITLTSDLPHALQAEAILYAQPAQHLRGFCRAARPHWPGHAALVLCAKGIEQQSGLLLHEIAASELPSARVTALSGPSFAIDVARSLPTAVAIAGTDGALVDDLMLALSHGAFRPYGSDDLAGVEVAGAVKNVLAIACGMVMGAGLGDNARAALITRGLAEVSRLVLAKGGRSETLMGLAGLGDLVLTCSSPKSRNMSLGQELGQGRTLAEILSQRHSVAEGVTTASAVVTLARSLGVEMPIAEAVNRILHQGSRLDAEVGALLSRPLRRESE